MQAIFIFPFELGKCGKERKQWHIQRLIWEHHERGKISWESVSRPVGTGQSPVGGRGAKPPENFDDLLVKIMFLKLNMPFYET